MGCELKDAMKYVCYDYQGFPNWVDLWGGGGQFGQNGHFKYFK